MSAIRYTESCADVTIKTPRRLLPWYRSSIRGWHQLCNAEHCRRCEFSILVLHAYVDYFVARFSMRCTRTVHVSAPQLPTEL